MDETYQRLITEMLELAEMTANKLIALNELIITQQKAIQGLEFRIKELEKGAL